MPNTVREHPLVLNPTTPHHQETIADEHLVSGPFLLIDAQNRGAGWVASPQDARDAIAKSTATTWAALPRHGVSALDLDMREGMSLLVADTVTDWCRARGLWWLLRPSGRPGHLHLWVLTLGHEAELEDLVDRIRAELRLSRPQLDVRSRQYIRPPSAPHRSGAPAVAGQLTDAHLADLVARLDGRTLAERQPPTASRRAADEVATYAARRVPLRRRRATSADAVTKTGDRSRDEFAQTLAAYNAGASADEAWHQVAASDGHSAARGRRWWQRCMWDQIEPAHARDSTTALVDAAQGSLPAIRARLAVLPDLDTRQAHSLDAVLWVVGEHIATATATAPQPVSERDVEGATGMDRKTIRAALARAVAAGIIVRHDATLPGDALAWSPGPAMQAARRDNPPPCLTPAAATWLHTLPRGSTTALTLHLTGQPVRPALAAALTAILAAVHDPPSVTHAECPAWPRIRTERDTFHTKIRASRAAYAAQWQASRAAAHRRDRAHALEWKHHHLARLRAERTSSSTQPPLPRLDRLPLPVRGGAVHHRASCLTVPHPHSSSPADSSSSPVTTDPRGRRSTACWAPPYRQPSHPPPPAPPPRL